MGAKNKVRFGIEQLHVAFLNTDGTYEKPKHVEGTVGLTTTPESQESEFWADNTKYYVTHANNGYTGDLESALIPDDILAKMLGWFFDTHGAMVEDADGKPQPFALLGQVQGDQRNRRFVYYHVTASRPGETKATRTETITPQTQSLGVTIMPVKKTVDNESKNIVKLVLELGDDNETVYNSFFNDVLEPSGLIPATDFSVLDAWIDYATAHHADELASEILAAEDVANNDAATQGEVDSAIATLTAAIVAVTGD